MPKRDLSRMPSTRRWKIAEFYTSVAFALNPPTINGERNKAVRIEKNIAQLLERSVRQISLANRANFVCDSPNAESWGG
jgi:hypothetical protein